ncbi:hypothetical protein GGR57DRAFT_306668 [Xylariaceae sp. FL1272]|nr:hypothetical protein GGR57DRAFT_306668 [Xylariaceae sp. FL1272]
MSTYNFSFAFVFAFSALNLSESDAFLHDYLRNTATAPDKLGRHRYLEVQSRNSGSSSPLIPTKTTNMWLPPELQYQIWGYYALPKGPLVHTVALHPTDNDKPIASSFEGRSQNCYLPDISTVRALMQVDKGSRDIVLRGHQLVRLGKRRTRTLADSTLEACRRRGYPATSDTIRAVYARSKPGRSKPDSCTLEPSFLSTMRSICITSGLSLEGW